MKVSQSIASHQQAKTLRALLFEFYQTWQGQSLFVQFFDALVFSLPFPYAGHSYRTNFDRAWVPWETDVSVNPGTLMLL